MVFEDMFEKYIDIIKYLSEKHEEFSFYRSRGEMLNAEMFFIFLYIVKIKPEIIFESGFLRGRSSLIILETLKRENIKCDYYISCVVKRPNVYFDYSNFNLIRGRGEDIIGDIGKKNSNKKMLSLIDGPKFKYYDMCSKVYNELFKNFKVQVVFQHDLDKTKDGDNYKKYYDNKVDKNKYEMAMISKRFLNKYVPLMDEDDIGEQRLGVICDNNLLMKDFS